MSPPGASLPGAAPVATPSSVTPSSAPKMDVFLNRAREKLRKAVKSNKKMAPSRPSDVIDDVNATRQRLSILDALDAQRRQQQFVDLTLKCAETSFPVHRSVMAAASPFFRAMLSVEMRESGQDVIELKDMDADAMEAVIDYIYTGQLRLPSWSLLLQLLLLGNMMQIEMLEKECTDLVEELMHELHRWIFAEAPPRTSMSADEDLQVCLNREDELRDAALGRDSLEFLLEVMYMFEEYPVVMNREDEVKRYGNQPANDKIPVAKARRNLCFKILRSPRVLEALAERHSDILNKFDTKMLEYLVKCPGVFYGFPDQIVLILSKKLLHEVGNEAESDDLESASDAIQMLLDWFLNLLLLMPKKCRDTNFMSRIFVKLFPEAGLSPETDFDVIDLTFRGQGHQVVNPSKDHGHHLLQLTFQTVLEHSGETPLLCQWSNDSLRMRISELDRGDEFVIHPPEKKEMIQMESSMRLWSGCYKTWLEVEEMSPTQVIHVEANQGSLSQVQGSLSPEAAQTDFVGAFEILKVFLAALHDGRTKEVKVFICGYDPISDSWISVGDDATVMYQNEDAETEAQTEITEVFAGASSDGKKIYIAVNSQTKGEKQRATYHMLSYEMASSSNLFKYVLMNKHVKRRNHVSAMTVTSGPRGDEVIIFGHAYSGALRIASTHSLLYWEANVPLERIKRPIPDHGDSASSVSENFLAVPLGDAVFCLLVNPRGAASMWKYSIIGDSWSRVLIPEMTNVSFLGFFVDVGVFLTEGQQPRLTIIYSQKESETKFSEEAAFYGLVGDPNRKEFGGFQFLEGVADWNPFSEKNKMKLLRFVAKLEADREAATTQGDADATAGQDVAEAKRFQLDAMCCLSRLEPIKAEKTKRDDFPTGVWYFHDEPKSRIVPPDPFCRN